MNTVQPAIALLTDFGTKDTYVGAMKGVILSIAPRAAVVDLSHGVAPQNIAEACYQLAASCSYFPTSTLFCCVVDPGVGSLRRAVAVQTERYIFVAPDNGLLTLALRAHPPLECVELSNPLLQLPNASSTFHGRDIFAPAVAHLAAGVAFASLGRRVECSALVQLADIDAVQTSSGWCGRVVSIDSFGNLITNIHSACVPDSALVEVGSKLVRGLSRTFSDVDNGCPVAYRGSSGFVEIAVRNGNAALQWCVSLGTAVSVSAE